MNEKLRILIEAGLNENLSVDQINKDLLKLAQDPRLKKLKVGIDLDTKHLKAIEDFAKATDKIKEAVKEQNKVISQHEDIVKKADGSVEKITRQTLKSGEIITRTRKIIDEKARSVEKDTAAMNKNAEAAGKLIRETEKFNAMRQPLSSTKTWRDKGTDTTYTFDPQGDFVGGRSVTDHLRIERIEQKRLELGRELQQMRERGIISTREIMQVERELANARTESAIKEIDNTRRTFLEKEKAIKKEMSLERQNLELRRRIQLQIDSMLGDPLFRRGRGQLIEYRSQLQRLGLNAQTTADQMRNIQHAVRQLRVEMQSAGVKTSTFIGAFQNALIKFPIWMGASTAFFGTVRGIRSALQNIIEVDTQMTTLARVSGGELERDHILREAGELAARLGNELKSVNESVIDFARQGFRGEGLIALTEAATLFSNISEMTPEEASSGLTAIIKGFNMLPEEVMVAVDAINEVDNNFAYSSQNIVASISKSVGAAQAFGVNLQELIGYTTAIGEVTRESGNIIGTPKVAA